MNRGSPDHRIREESGCVLRHDVLSACPDPKSSDVAHDVGMTVVPSFVTEVGLETPRTLSHHLASRVCYLGHIAEASTIYPDMD